MQVHAIPSREFVRFEKRFISCIFPAMSTRCIAAGVFCCWRQQTTKMGLVGKVVRSDFFSSAVQQTLRAVVIQISRLDRRHEQRPLGSGLLFKFVNTMETTFLEP